MNRFDQATSKHTLDNASMHWLTILNTSILTGYGTYDYQPLTLDEARGYYGEYEYGAQMVQSAVGHESTACILHCLLGESAGIVCREQYKQPVGAKALVFKLRGRPPEGKVLTIAEINEIGFDFGLLVRIS